MAPWQASNHRLMAAYADDTFPTPIKPGFKCRFSISTDGGKDPTVPIDTSFPRAVIPCSRLVAAGGPVTQAELHEPGLPSSAQQRSQPASSKLKRPSHRNLRSFASIERLRSFARSPTFSRIPPLSLIQPSSVPITRSDCATPATSPATQPSTDT